MSNSQTLLDDSTYLIYQSTSSFVSASEAIPTSMMNVDSPSPTLTTSVASDSYFSSSSSFDFFEPSAPSASSDQDQSPTVSTVVSPSVSRPAFRPSRLPSHSTRTSSAKTVFSYTTSSFNVPLSRASSSTSKLTIVNVIPSPHPSHSLNVAHSVQPIPSTNSSLSVSTTHTLSSTTQLNDQKDTGLFTFITISSYSSEPTLAPPSLSLSTPSASSNQTSNSVSPSSAKPSHTTGVILGTIGAVCFAFVLGLIILYYRRRRRNYSSVSTTPRSDRHSFTYSSNGGIASSLALNSGETPEITYKGSRRFRFPQVANLSRQPLTLSPPTTKSFKSKIDFPVGSTFDSGLNSQISSPAVLPPSLEQSLGGSLSLPPPQYFPSRNSLIASPSEPVAPPWNSTCTTSTFNKPGERSPPSTLGARTQPSIPQIRLEYVETQTPSTVYTSASPSQDSIRIPKPMYSSPIAPSSGSTFLAPPTPKYTSIVKPPVGTTSPPPLTSSPVGPPVTILSTKPEKQQETKNPEPQSPRFATATVTQAGPIFSAKRLTWASTLRANLFNAVQFMNSTPEEEGDVDDRESEISSLFSERSDSESGKSIAAAALLAAGAPVGKAVRGEVKKPLRPQRTTWVIVNGGTRPESQSVESLSDAYHIIK